MSDPSSTKRVEGHGPLTCDIAVVGEAPGAEEDASGIPFVGSSGKLLSNDILAKAGIHRKVRDVFVPGVGTHVEVDSSIYVTNVVKCWPGSGDDRAFVKRFYEDASLKRPTAELAACWAELKQELAPCTANVIIAVGQHSLRALCSKRGITNWAGSILNSTLMPGRKVIPMIHPAHVLREWYWRTFCIFDAKRAKAQSSFPEIRRKERTFVIRPTLEQVLDAEEQLTKAEFISTDIETKGNNIACIGFAPSERWGICIPFCSGQDHYWPSAEIEARVWLACHRILTAPSKKILQNSLFDMSHLATHGIAMANLWLDTMLLQNIIYPELEKSLAVLTHLYTEESFYKDMGRRALKAKGDIADKSWDPRQSDEELWRYNLLDCMITFEVAFAQLEELRELTAPAVAKVAA